MLLLMLLLVLLLVLLLGLLRLLVLTPLLQWISGGLFEREFFASDAFQFYGKVPGTQVW